MRRVLPPASTISRDAIVAGLLGAAVIALWFFVLDTLSGRPLSTPTLLNGLVVVGLGGVVAWLLGLHRGRHALCQSCARPSVLVANVLAAAAIAACFRWRHPRLVVRP